MKLSKSNTMLIYEYFFCECGVLSFKDDINSTSPYLTRTYDVLLEIAIDREPKVSSAMGFIERARETLNMLYFYQNE